MWMCYVLARGLHADSGRRCAVWALELATAPRRRPRSGGATAAEAALLAPSAPDPFRLVYFPVVQFQIKRLPEAGAIYFQNIILA